MFAVCLIKNYGAKLYRQKEICNRVKIISFVINTKSACYRVATTVLQGCNIYKNAVFLDKKIDNRLQNTTKLINFVCHKNKL